ncbi:MAG: Tetratricopeptide 2 repeat protein [Bryobacterales bacterium]|nr:Tetratricopeptide 2 repeat protein [Bryobacterales bacterium]
MSLSKAVFLSLFLHATLQAQGRPVRGEVLSSKPFSGHYFAEIYDSTSHRVIERAFVSSSGQFEFRNVAREAYTVRISTESGDTVASAPLNAGPIDFPLEIRLPEPKEAKPVSGVVSVSTLRNPPARKASAEFDKARKFLQAGDSPHAIEHLRKAIEISPNYADAHTSLGVQYMLAERYQDALAEYQTVLGIGPAGTRELCNLSAAFFCVRRFAEAEDSARRAVALDSRHPFAHYLLGRALLVDPGKQAESRKHLQLAAPDIPQAAAYLAAYK